MYMLIMVLDDVAHLNEVLSAWKSSGISGVTIMESTGLHRMLLRHRPEAAYVGFSRVFGSSHHAGHNTLFAVVDNMAIIEAAVRATEGIVGKLDQPNTGIMFALPVTKVWGMSHDGQALDEEREG